MKNCRVHPTHWLISTQVPTRRCAGLLYTKAAHGDEPGTETWRLRWHAFDGNELLGAVADCRAPSDAALCGVVREAAVGARVDSVVGAMDVALGAFPSSAA